MMDWDMLDNPPSSPCAKCRWVGGQDPVYFVPASWVCRHKAHERLVYDPMTGNPHTVRKYCEDVNPIGDCQLFEAKRPEDEKPKKSLMGRICEMVFGR